MKVHVWEVLSTWAGGIVLMARNISDVLEQELKYLGSFPITKSVH